MSRKRLFFLDWEWVIALEALFFPLIQVYSKCSHDTPFTPRLAYGTIMGFVFLFLPGFSFFRWFLACFFWELISASLWSLEEEWSVITGTIMDFVLLFAVVSVLVI